jgi:phosphatidylglycerophosphate synthase
MARGYTRAVDEGTRLRFSDLANLAGVLPLAFVTAFVMYDRPLLIAVFAGCVITDVADGFVARRTGTASRTGAVADGWADKIFLINFAWTLQMLGLIEPWHMWLWFVRELIQGVMVPLVALDYALKRKPHPRPVITGKLATTAIGLAISACFLEWWLLRDVFTWAAAALGLHAALFYAWRDKPWRRFFGGQGEDSG